MSPIRSWIVPSPYPIIPWKRYSSSPRQPFFQNHKKESRQFFQLILSSVHKSHAQSRDCGEYIIAVMSLFFISLFQTFYSARLVNVISWYRKWWGRTSEMETWPRNRTLPSWFDGSRLKSCKVRRVRRLYQNRWEDHSPWINTWILKSSNWGINNGALFGGRESE